MDLKYKIRSFINGVMHYSLNSKKYYMYYNHNFPRGIIGLDFYWSDLKHIHNDPLGIKIKAQ